MITITTNEKELLQKTNKPEDIFKILQNYILKLYELGLNIKTIQKLISDETNKHIKYTTLYYLIKKNGSKKNIKNNTNEQKIENPFFKNLI